MAKPRSSRPVTIKGPKRTAETRTHISSSQETFFFSSFKPMDGKIGDLILFDMDNNPRAFSVTKEGRPCNDYTG